MHVCIAKLILVGTFPGLTERFYKSYLGRTLTWLMWALRTAFLHDNGLGEGSHTECPDQPGDGTIWRPSTLNTRTQVLRDMHRVRQTHVDRRRPHRLIPL